MTKEEIEDLKKYVQDDKIDDKVHEMETRVTKYRELYGAASPAFNMAFAASVLTFALGVYAMVEHGIEVERYGNYLDKMAKSGVRYMPNSETLLWLELPDSVAGSYLRGLYQFDFVVTLVTLVGGLLLTASCSWRLVQSVRNWRKLSGGFDLESLELGRGNYDELLANLFGGMTKAEVDDLYLSASTDTTRTEIPMSMSVVHSRV
jgi:hypothetical protein